MNTLTMYTRSGKEETIESREPFFNLSDFLNKYYKLTNPYNFNCDYQRMNNLWKNYIKSTGGTATLHRLMKKYEVENWQPFYPIIEFKDGSFIGAAHYKLILGFIEQNKYNTRVDISTIIQLDNEGKNWKPTVFTNAVPIVKKIPETLLSLISENNIDKRVVWFNKALSVACGEPEWMSVPYELFTDKTYKKFERLTKEIENKIKSQEIKNFEELKQFLLSKWVEKSMPDIFKPN